jgi:hypothetical protein
MPPVAATQHEPLEYTTGNPHFSLEQRLLCMARARMMIVSPLKKILTSKPSSALITCRQNQLLLASETLAQAVPLHMLLQWSLVQPSPLAQCPRRPAFC